MTFYLIFMAAWWSDETYHASNVLIEHNAWDKSMQQ